MHTTDAKIILGSSSKYRRQLLEKIGLSFQQISPEIDETPAPGESAAGLCTRLARQKAEKLRPQYPHHILITSDQCASTDSGEIVGKPGTRERAIAQLQQFAGKTLVFHTAICVYDASGQLLEDIDTCEVVFRPLTIEQIRRYVDRDNPLDCAGSFKSESLGIALIEKIRGNDPNTLIGLPLIRLIDLLKKAKVNVL